MFKYRDLIGQKFFYPDKSSGVGWEIEVFETYRNESDSATVLVLTDYVRVDMHRFDTLRGTTHIIDKILNTYEHAISNLEYKNG